MDARLAREDALWVIAVLLGANSVKPCRSLSRMVKSGAGAVWFVLELKKGKLMLRRTSARSVREALSLRTVSVRFLGKSMTWSMVKIVTLSKVDVFETMGSVLAHMQMKSIMLCKYIKLMLTITIS